ncbi:MAG: AzlD domain-containing protein [Azospirillaceae bacterium]
MERVDPALVIIVGAAVTYFWRGLGVALAGRLKADSPWLGWVTCVAFALLAGLIARMITLPIGPLAEAPLIARLAGAGVALGLFFFVRRDLLVAVLGGAVALVGLTLAGL